MLLNVVILYTPAAPPLGDSTNRLRMKHLHRHQGGTYTGSSTSTRQSTCTATKHGTHTFRAVLACTHTHTLFNLTNSFLAVLAGTHTLKSHAHVLCLTCRHTRYRSNRGAPDTERLHKRTTSKDTKQRDATR